MARNNSRNQAANERQSSKCNGAKECVRIERAVANPRAEMAQQKQPVAEKSNSTMRAYHVFDIRACCAHNVRRKLEILIAIARPEHTFTASTNAQTLQARA